MIAIVNYGLGNLGSIRNMFRRLAVDAEIVNRPEELDQYKKIVLPGVGAFDSGMRHLSENGWLEPLNQKVLVEKVPTLGICLGMQLMTRRSEEGVLPGLSWIDAEVIRFRSSELKIPHMGWNVVSPAHSPSILKDDADSEIRFYFVHSYYVELANEPDLLGTTTYGGTFASAFQHENIFGVQFHPEKSHKFGMNLFKNFSRL